MRFIEKVPFEEVRERCFLVLLWPFCSLLAFSYLFKRFKEHARNNFSFFLSRKVVMW